MVSYVNPASEGNAIDFGDLTENSERSSGLSSSTRAVRLGEETISNYQDTMILQLSQQQEIIQFW